MALLQEVEKDATLPLFGPTKPPEPMSNVPLVRVGEPRRSLAERVSRIVRRLLGREALSTQLDTIGAVERDPQTWGGAAVLAGTRVPLFAIEDTYRERGGLEGVRSSYPFLTEADIFVALAFAMLDAEGVQNDRDNYFRLIPPELRA